MANPDSLAVSRPARRAHRASLWRGVVLGLTVACREPVPAPGVETTLPKPDPSGLILLTNLHNFSYVGDLDVPFYPTVPGVDIRFDWSTATDDLQCHALSPVDDIDNLAVLALPNLDEAGVEYGLSNDSLQQADMGGYVSYAPGDETEAWLSSFTFFGTDTDIETLHQLDTGSWLLLVTSGDTLGVGARLLALFTPTAEASATEVELGSGCGILSFEADLEALTPAAALVDGPWLVDWTGLTLDGRTHPIEATRINQLMVARYPGRTIREIEEGFLDLELDAEELWTTQLTGGTTADLASLGNSAGPFPGFAAEGPWLLALRCTLCSNPAPRFLTVLVPS